MASVLTPWGFEDADEVVYRAVLRKPGILVEEIAAAHRMAVDDVLRSARRLVRSRLVRRRGAGMAALRPDIALAVLARDTDADLEQRATDLEAVPGVVAALQAEYGFGLADATGPAAVAFGSDADLAEALDRALAEPPYDGRADRVWLMAQPPLRRTPDVGAALRRARRRGHTEVRLLLTQDVVDVPGQWTYVSALLAAGVPVRVMPRVATNLLLVEGKLAALPAADGQGSEQGDEPGGSAGSVVGRLVRHPAVLGAVATLVTLAWDVATPISHGAASEAGAQDALLPLLAAGMQDDAAARELGVSVRTVRRRIADLLSELDARTRFQAGVQVARRGVR